MDDSISPRCFDGDDHVPIQTSTCFPFLSLPPELMLRTFDYLESTFVITIVGQVCKYLHELVNDPTIWRLRLRKRWSGKRYLVVAGHEVLDWKKACMKSESEYQFWKQPEATMDLSDLHVSHACIDTVHICHQMDLIAFASRDHSLSVYKLSSLPSDASISPAMLSKHKIFVESEAHRGWVWTVNSNHDNLLCSGGWDTKVKLWSLDGTCLSTYTCGSPVICSAMDENEIVAGTMNQRLVQIDVRSNNVTMKQVGCKALLCLQATPQWLITGHESRTINIFDRKTLRLVNVVNCKSGYPKSMCLFGNLLYIGCRDGTVNLYEFNHTLGSLVFLETLQESDDRKMEVRAIQPTLGSVLTANKDGMVKIWEPSSHPALINQLKLDSEICDMTYVNNTLAIGLSTGIVRLYRPKPAKLNH